MDRRAVAPVDVLRHQLDRLLPVAESHREAADAPGEPRARLLLQRRLEDRDLPLDAVPAQVGAVGRGVRLQDFLEPCESVVDDLELRGCAGKFSPPRLRRGERALVGGVVLEVRPRVCNRRHHLHLGLEAVEPLGDSRVLVRLEGDDVVKGAVAELARQQAQACVFGVLRVDLEVLLHPLAHRLGFAPDADDHASSAQIRQLVRRVAVLHLLADSLLGEARDRLRPRLDDRQRSALSGRLRQFAVQDLLQPLVARSQLAVLRHLLLQPLIVP